jgi:hypothetical protein
VSRSCPLASHAQRNQHARTGRQDSCNTLLLRLYAHAVLRALYASCRCPNRLYPCLVSALAYLRDEGGVVGSAPPLLGAARAPQGFLADTGFTPAAAGAVTGLMLVPVVKRRAQQSRRVQQVVGHLGLGSCWLRSQTTTL